MYVLYKTEQRYPRAFTEHYGSLIDRYVCLNMKDDYRWVVHVERRNSKIWIRDNLEQFKEIYNLQVLDTLYFKHKNQNLLKVVMFSVTCLQYGWGRFWPGSFLKKPVTRDYATKIIFVFRWSLHPRGLPVAGTILEDQSAREPECFWFKIMQSLISWSCHHAN